MANKDGLANTIRRLRFDHDEMTQQDLPLAPRSVGRPSSRWNPASTHRRWLWVCESPECLGSASMRYLRWRIEGCGFPEWRNRNALRRTALETWHRTITQRGPRDQESP